MRRLAYRYLSFAFLAAGTWACGSTEPAEEVNDAGRLSAEIRQLEEKILASMPDADTATASVLIDEMIRYADLFPQDTLSAVYRIKVANLYMLFPDREVDALRQLQIVYTKNPGQPYAAQALFLSGLIYDNNLRQPGQAIQMWSRLVDEYPTHELAGQAVNLLKITDADPHNDVEMIERWLSNPQNKTHESAQKNNE
ncbi:MAG: tetratricopeptide repeat protein [Thermaurantimonas sp.]